jgi:23S rRNA pseudouridine2605 synthase
MAGNERSGRKAGGGQAPEPRIPGQRIAKAMARAGLCSRRDAEAWIANGRVVVNGAILSSPALNITEGDDVRVDGRPLALAERTRLFLFHKPRGLVTTARDPEGRPTIFDALPEDAPRLIAVGRLDINTEGLILLTNDGGLARVLELPATGWLRRYRVRAHGEIEQAQLDPLAGGITIDGVDYAGIEATLDRSQGSNAWMTLGLREGKNREIKKVLEHLGLSVNRLIRISFGPFQLGDLEEGQLAEVRTRVLSDQLGAKLARQAGVDFAAPLREEGQGSAPPPPAPARKGRGGDRPLTRGRPGAREERREAPPPMERPLHTQARSRKHVSAIRSARDEDVAGGERKRVDRGATADRKGRAVAVERLVAARPDKRAGPKFKHGDRWRSDGPGGAPGRMGDERVAPARDDARPRGERPASGEKPRAYRPRAGADAARPGRDESRPRFDKGEGARPRAYAPRVNKDGARPERDARPRRDDARPRFDKAAGGEKPRVFRARAGADSVRTDRDARPPRDERKSGFKNPRSDKTGDKPRNYGPRAGANPAHPDRERRPGDERRPRFDKAGDKPRVFRASPGGPDAGAKEPRRGGKPVPRRPGGKPARPK